VNFAATPHKLLRTTALSLGAVILTVAGLAATAMAVAPRLGYNRYVITGRSMTGTIDRGSVIYDRLVPTSSLKIGDVITYQPPMGSGPQGLVTHRIVWIGRDAHGLRAFRTKGDHNPAPDTWKFVLSKPMQAEVAFHVPYVGYGLVAVSRPQARMILIGLPALLVALAVLSGLWEDAGREARGEGRVEVAA